MCPSHLQVGRKKGNTLPFLYLPLLCQQIELLQRHVLVTVYFPPRSLSGLHCSTLALDIFYSFSAACAAATGHRLRPCVCGERAMHVEGKGALLTMDGERADTAPSPQRSTEASLLAYCGQWAEAAPRRAQLRAGADSSPCLNAPATKPHSSCCHDCVGLQRQRQDCERPI